MRAAGIRGMSRRRWITTTTRTLAARPAPDLEQRRFTAPEPNRLWVVGNTYFIGKPTGRVSPHHAGGTSTGSRPNGVPFPLSATRV
jgi:hypothetical protein